MKKLKLFLFLILINTGFSYDLEVDVTTRSLNKNIYEKKVIKEEDVKKVKDLSELINLVTLYFSKTQPGALGSVWINGTKTTDSDIFSSSGVLLLINGHPVNGLIDNLPIEIIENIEIIEGPFSSSYGSGAIGGIINIITKKKIDNKVGINLEYGSFEYTKAGFFFGIDKNFGLITTGNYEERKDYETSKGKYYNTDYKKNTAYLGYITSMGDNILELSFNYFKSKNGVPFKIYLNDLDDYVDITNINSDIKFKSLFEKLAISNTLYISYNKRSNYGIDSLWPYESHSKLTTLGYQGNILIPSIDLNTGLDFSYSTISKQNETGNYNQPDTYNINLSSFAETNKEIGSFNFLLGLRYDAYLMKIEDSKGITFIGNKKEDSFKYLSTRGGLSYELYKKFLIKIFGGTGFRAPSILERYGTYIGPWGNYQGNPTLKPEKSIGINTTIGYYSENTAYINLGYLKIYDRISTIYNTLTFTTTYYNQQKAEILNTKGVLSLELIKLPLSIKTNIEGVYNIKAKDEKGDNLLYLPKIKIVSTLTIEKDFFTLIITDTYTSKVYDLGNKNIGNFNILSCSLLGKIKLGEDKDLKAKLNINNITNEYYQFVEGFPMPKRNYELGVEYSMKI